MPQSKRRANQSESPLIRSTLIESLRKLKTDFSILKKLFPETLCDARRHRQTYRLTVLLQHMELSRVEFYDCSTFRNLQITRTASSSNGNVLIYKIWKFQSLLKQNQILIASEYCKTKQNKNFSDKRENVFYSPIKL